ncbi:MAG: type II toxin-antitoxin system VapC family toxin [Sphingomonadaceae bacterium]
MRLLLDTCTFLWFAESPDRLGRAAREVLQDPNHEPFVSAVSIWEILVKLALGKAMTLHVPTAPERYFIELRQRLGLSALAMTEETAAQVLKLPPIHHDPFDRLLICQAIEHGMALVTPARAIQRYPIRTLWT